MKPGYRTTEFWATLGTAIASVVVALGGDAETATWVKALAVAAGTVVTSVYTLARTVLKRTNGGR